MARVHEKILAWVSVLVVLFGVGALSAASIIQQIMTDQAAKSAPQASTAQTCSDNQAETPLPAPTTGTTNAPTTTLLSIDLSVGSGAAAKAGDCLAVKYYGTLASNGTMFDETYTKPSGFAFTLGQGQVIPGWDQGLVGMKVGGERRLVIPSALAYGSQPQGSIPANSDLVFYVKLLRIQ